MDAFTTAVTAGDIVLTYLEACASYSQEALSLYHRFKWDLRVLKEIVGFFKQRRSRGSDIQPLSKDEVLLNETADYLAVLIGRVSASFTKIQASGFLKKTINQGLWVTRRKGLKELEQELNEWTNRFDIHLLGLPAEIKNIIPPAPNAGDDGTPITNILASNLRMKKFAGLASKAREQQTSQLLRDPPDELIRLLEESPSPTTRVFQIGAQEFILTSRPFPPNVRPGSEEFRRFTSDLDELAAALHVLEPATDVPLLKVEYFFYEIATGRFLFVQVPPHPVDEVLTLDVMIERTPYPHMVNERKTWLPLNQRLTLAKKLAEALFFLHTAGFVHKNLITSSVISLQQSNAPPSACFPYTIGEPYLVGFDIIRSETGISLLEGALNANLNDFQQQSITKRNIQVFRHPDRLHDEPDKIRRYIKNYDMYSLGVILLQIGLWEPISTVTMKLEDDFTSWPESLHKISNQLGLRVGSKYQKVVAWCLGLKGDYVIKDVEFATEVLDPLEDIANALV
ncbi:uncharacterized protein F4822DRAFT_408016 [Hypoxylon trugodes]|uniref:uncharacterized protein n=1 Tax=Hypoxylon trugodes TaxID=326681 RepID=UPI00219A3FE8|nr:uncharacterized protein F4822DRAFT_408016 [Hypoxylon trugodes]KAI1387930.1 hypothetical protein F4822DRAFT_408016 [Hypoxylon trugodes]